MFLEWTGCRVRRVGCPGMWSVIQLDFGTGLTLVRHILRGTLIKCRPSVSLFSAASCLINYSKNQPPRTTKLEIVWITHGRVVLAFIPQWYLLRSWCIMTGSPDFPQTTCERSTQSPIPLSTKSPWVLWQAHLCSWFSYHLPSLMDFRKSQNRLPPPCPLGGHLAYLPACIKGCKNICPSDCERL